MTWHERMGYVGGLILRYSLVLFFLAFGALKFTAGEAEAIEPLIAHSPFLFWVHALFGRQGGSDLIGVIEIALGLAIASRPILPRVSAWGAMGVAAALCVTLSFLVTTPGLDRTSVFAFFVAKDLTLLGAALWCASEAFTALGRAAAAQAPAFEPIGTRR